MSKDARSEVEMEEARRKIKAILDDFAIRQKEKDEGSIHFKGRDLKESFDTLANSTLDFVMGFAENPEVDLNQLIEELEFKMLPAVEMSIVGRVTVDAIGRMESMFYEDGPDNKKVPTNSTQKMLDDRWPITTQLYYYYEAHKARPDLPLEFFVTLGIANTLNENNTTSYLTRDEVNELLTYFAAEDYKACYFFAGSYCERVFADLVGDVRVAGFKAKLQNLHAPFKDGWGGPLLNGFLGAIEQHWGDTDRAIGVPRVTRHSIAHGIQSERQATNRDALQMLLILQMLPFWMEHIKELAEIEQLQSEHGSQQPT